jgi:3-oxoacyl-[acyl-carrier protein] reductase
MSESRARFGDRLDVGLQGKTAVLIGGGPGIGQAVAHAFVAADCTTVVTDVNLVAAKGTCDMLGPKAEPLHVDVLDRASVRAMLADVVERHGAPIGVVDVVGVARAKTFEDTKDEDWDVMQNLNLRQQFIVAQEAVRVIQPGGSYVAIASLNGTVSSPFNIAYGSAKAGLVSLVRSLAVEIAPPESG